MDYEFEELNEEDSDVLMSLQHDDGTRVTFLTAPPEVFTTVDELEPLITRLDENRIFVAFNGDLIEKLIQESIDRNGEIYGRDSSAFLPMTLVINKGLKAVNRFICEEENPNNT